MSDDQQGLTSAEVNSDRLDLMEADLDHIKELILWMLAEGRRQVHLLEQIPNGEEAPSSSPD